MLVKRTNVILSSHGIKIRIEQKLCIQFEKSRAKRFFGLIWFGLIVFFLVQFKLIFFWLNLVLKSAKSEEEK